jgi:hypothetical protein
VLHLTLEFTQAARDSVVGRMCTATLINNIEVY